MQRNNERTWLALILGIFSVGALWLILHFSISEVEPMPPMSTYSSRPTGAKALYDLMLRVGYQAERFGDLEYHYPPQACMVILDQPELSVSAMVGGTLDVKALRLWMEQGGRLLLFSDPLRQTGHELMLELAPDAGQGYDFRNELLARRSETLTTGSADAIWRSFQHSYRYELDADRPQLFEDVGEIEIALPAMHEFVNAQVLLASDEPLQPIVLYKQVGAGMLLWVTCPEIACNDWIARADNHKLLLSLVEMAAGGGPLYFDEHLHGFYKRQANVLQLLLFTGGGRLLLALAVVLSMLFLGQMISAARVAVQPVIARRQTSEIVLAQADLYQRAGQLQIIARNLIDGLRRQLMLAKHASRLPGDDEILRWLGSTSPGLAAEAQIVAAWLSAGATKLTPGQLLRLAQACDKLRVALHDA